MSVKLIRLKRLVDLVHVLSVSQIPLIHHYQLDSTHIYFVPAIGGGEPSVVYYYETPQPLQGAYILFNNFTGELLLSNEWLSDSKFTIIPVVEVEKQSFFSDKELLSELRSLRMHRKKEKNPHMLESTVAVPTE